MLILHLHLEILFSEPSAQMWHFEKPLFSILKKQKIPKKNWDDQNLYPYSVVPNDPLVIEPFFETMELWHV
jgi:hypothetical protein